MNTFATEDRQKVAHWRFTEHLPKRNLVQLFQLKLPMLVMRLPGCYEVFVNDAYSLAFNGAMKILPEKAAYLPLLDDDLRKSAKADLSRLLCFCSKFLGVLALEPKHCSFESVAGTLLQRKPQTWGHSLGYFKLRELAAGVRSYQVFDVRSTRIPDLGDKKTFYLQSILQKLPGLQIRLHNFEADLVRPRNIRVSVNLDGKTWIAPRDYAIEVETGPYDQLHSALIQSHRHLVKVGASKAKAFLASEAERIAPNYKPVAAFALDIFQDESKASDRLIMAARRVFDAKLIVEKIEPSIVKMLAEERSFSSTIGGLDEVLAACSGFDFFGDVRLPAVADASELKQGIAIQQGVNELLVKIAQLKTAYEQSNRLDREIARACKEVENEAEEILKLCQTKTS